ncbi:hypothetical protein ACH5RR_032321 [Cinchona calisaya]|uniref:CCHC-type domain-containing protein n=1 Tax=Cinchona calisaya TaxID=153742 RepID=A0ABD2YHR0_9GENT
MKLLVLVHMASSLGYGIEVKLIDKIPMVEGKFRLRQIGIEDDVVDMAGIGKQNGSVEFYVTEENNIAFLDGEVSKGDNEDSEVDSGFADSDYDFSKDDEALIYNEFVASIDGDLSNRISSERKMGIPCSHAICCIQVIGEEPERFVNQCYSKDAYVRAYAPVMGPVNGSNAWPDSKKDPIHAPKMLKLPGRPKKARKREPDEQKNDPTATKKLIRVGITHMTCSGCHQKGHTIRKCPQKLPKDDLVPSCSDRGSSINSNKCGRCHVIGHNIRRCPGNQVEMEVNHENSEVPQAYVEVANIQLEMVATQQNHSRETNDDGCLVQGNNDVKDINENNEGPTVISQVMQEVITIPQQNVQPKKRVRCYFCHNIGHNKKTYMSQQAQDWRNRKAEILFPTYVPS